MADNSGIQWTDATWQVSHGCSLASPGCAHCYAMREAARLERMGVRQYAGLTKPSSAGPVWTGDVREADLGDVPQPLRWRRPRRVFIDSMSDLFHPDVGSDHIADVFGVMACAQQHVFQVLTKRIERAADLLATSRFISEVFGAAAVYAHLVSAEAAYRDVLRGYGLGTPLPNVWIGTSVEDQRRAEERIPHLRRTPAAVRFLSCEPLLEAIAPDLRGLDWVIIGGESGPRARPMAEAWAMSLIHDCQAEGVPVFMKQFGSHPGLFRDEKILFSRGKRDDPATWPEWARARDFPRGAAA